MNLKPCGKNLLVQKRIVEEVKRGLLILPEDKPNFVVCDVLGVGEKVESFIEGDVILIQAFIGVEIEYEGIKLLVLDSGNVLAKVSQ